MSSLKNDINAEIEVSRYLLNSLKKQWEQSDLFEFEKQIALDRQFPELQLPPIDQETIKIIGKFREEEINKILAPLKK